MGADIYKNRGKGPGAVSRKPHSPMAATRPHVRSEKKSKKMESRKEGPGEILVPTGLQISASGGLLLEHFEVKAKR